MQRVFFFAVNVCLFLFLITRPAAAFDDWQPVTEEERKMTVDPAHPQDAVILYHEEIANDNKSDREVYMRMKILTERGKERANVEIPYGFNNEGITGFKARTISPDGTITNFSGKPFNATIAKGHGIKYQAKTFALPNVQVGSIIEWKYVEYWDGYVVAPHWSIQKDLLQKRAKFVFLPFSKNGYYIEDERGQIKDRVFRSFVGLSPNTDLKQYPDGRLELELKDIPAFEEEEFGLPPETLKMRVDFYYGTEKMGKPDDFWRDEGKYWSKDVEKFIGHSSAVAALAAQAVGAGDTPEQKVRKLYAEAQKIKNSTYEFKTDFDDLVVPDRSAARRTIDDVLRQKSGSREEITRLFVAMVRSINIPAFVMRVADRDQTIFQPAIPNWRQLNTEIAIVNLNGKDVFLDPGTPSSPYGLLEWKHTSVSGVRQTASGTTQIAQTPSPEYRDAYTQRIARVNMDADGTLHGKIALAWLGQEGLAHRLIGLQTDEAGRRKDMEEELANMLPQGAEVHLDSVKGWDDAGAPLVAAYTVRIPSFATSAGKRLMVPVALFQARSKPVLTRAERKTPIYFPYPYQTHDDIQLGLPPSIKVEHVPSTAPVKKDFAFYNIQRNLAGGMLEIKRDFAIGGMAFPQKEYADLKGFFESVNTADAEQVVMNAATPAESAPAQQ